MENLRISAIAAIGKNRELGTQNQLSWRIKEDLKRVKDLTTGHPIIMGRKTYESIGRPLPNRTNIVITRDTEYKAEGCTIVHSIDEALEYAQGIEKDEIFIFGGAQIYELAMPHITRLYLTLIDDTDSNADAFFPEYEHEFTVTEESERKEQDGMWYRWVTMERT